MAYKHNGFWQCMDTLRDKIFLDEYFKKKEIEKKILIIGHGFLAKSLINNFSKRSNFNIFVSLNKKIYSEL